MASAGVMRKGSKSRSKGKGGRNQTNAGSRELNLSGFQPVMWPTVFPAKLVYSDYRTLTCSGSQAEYVYRLNSLFDPDVTGVGGQPDGYDQLKVMYNRYRVVACGVEVEAIGQSANGLLAIAPTDVAGGFTSAEEVAGLRNAVSATFSATQKAKVSKLYHIGKLLGYSDASVLGNTNLEAAVGSNPTFQQYLTVAVEGGTSATQVQNLLVRLTYYARMEVPIAVIDAVDARRANRETGTAPIRAVEEATASCATGTEKPAVSGAMPPFASTQIAMIGNRRCEDHDCGRCYRDCPPTKALSAGHGAGQL